MKNEHLNCIVRMRASDVKKLVEQFGIDPTALDVPVTPKEQVHIFRLTPVVALCKYFVGRRVKIEHPTDPDAYRIIKNGKPTTPDKPKKIRKPKETVTFYHNYYLQGRKDTIESILAISCGKTSRGCYIPIVNI